MTLRHFPHPHPTFGTKHKPKPLSAQKKSVYYWWWKYLRRNEDYKRCCETGGKGKCAKLYADFGDVHATDFKTWWTTDNRGAELFAEPPTPDIRVLASMEEAIERERNWLLLDVPLNLPITHLVKKFRAILKKHHTSKRGVKYSNSTKAKYPVATGRIDVQFLETALQVWDARMAEPKKPLWQITQELKLVPSKHWVRGEDDLDATNKKNLLAATASRYMRKAEAIIWSSEFGRFPTAESVPPPAKRSS
jgi:hypothetical protein